MKRTVSAILLVMLLTSMLCSAFRVMPAGLGSGMRVVAFIQNSWNISTNLVRGELYHSYMVQGLDWRDGYFEEDERYPGFEVLYVEANITDPQNNQTIFVITMGKASGFLAILDINLTLNGGGLDATPFYRNISNSYYEVGGIAQFDGNYTFQFRTFPDRNDPPVSISIYNDLIWTTIYIRADGTIDPPDANISMVNSYTYVFTDDISGDIVVEKDNVVIDGGGHTLQAAFANYGIGIDLRRNNVTIKNINITNFRLGTRLQGFNNSVVWNNITNNSDCGIWLEYSSSGNIISGNNIANNGVGIYLEDSCSNNVIYHNNFLHNTNQVYSWGTTNAWDDGYPSGGNCWSDYAGADVKSGFYQNEPGSDGIGDTPYVIDADNQDRYPLMHPWSPLPVHNMNTGLGYATIQEAINNANDGDTILVAPGVYPENGILINKSVSIIGSDIDTTIVTGGAPAINVLVDNVTIKGFTIKEFGGCSWGNAINGSNIRNLRVEELDIREGLIPYNTAVIYLRNSSGCIIRKVRINCSSLSQDSYGIVLHKYNVDCVLEKNDIFGMTDSISAIAIDAPGGSVVVRDNNLHSAAIAPGSYLGLLAAGNGNVSIIGNTFSFPNSLNLFVNCFDSKYSIYHNNFYDHMPSATGGNDWDNGFEGNYWTDYNGTDYDGNGIGDIPYILNDKNIDHYPLMGPWTVTGENVAVNHASGVSLIFGNVTDAGVTTVNQTEIGPDPPAEFELATDPPVYYDIKTTANYNGAIKLAIPYNDTGLTQEQENSLSLMHWNETLQQWTNITTLVDTENNIIYGETDSFSLFALVTSTYGPGDVNKDGTVDIFDIVIVALEFGHPPPPIVDLRADVNKDGLVDIFDIVIVALHFGETG